jgi:putative tryptophan/tyrosine transport system substrate-binding protein
VPSLAVESIAADVHSEADIENVIRKVGSEPDNGLFVLPDSHNVVHRKRIIELAAKYRLPTIYYFRYFASDGGLISYGPDEMDLFRRTAGYVDRILKGTNPADLSVQQPTKFELVINLKTAGIQMPASLLAGADEVIESSPMSVIGTKRTCASGLQMSAFGGKADMTIALRNVRI